MRKEIGQSFTLPNPFSCLGYLPRAGMPAAKSHLTYDILPLYISVRANTHWLHTDQSRPRCSTL